MCMQLIDVVNFVCQPFLQRLCLSGVFKYAHMYWCGELCLILHILYNTYGRRLLNGLLWFNFSLWLYFLLGMMNGSYFLLLCFRSLVVADLIVVSETVHVVSYAFWSCCYIIIYFTSSPPALMLATCRGVATLNNVCMMDHHPRPALLFLWSKPPRFLCEPPIQL